MRKTLLLLVAQAFLPQMIFAAQMYVYFGTQREGPDAGFSLARFDTETGALSKPQLIEKADAPSYFVINPDGKRLYTTNFRGAGGISAYRIDPKTGALTLINRISGNGASTTYVGLDQSGRFALAANFERGHIAAFRINDDGSLGERTAYDIHTGSSVNPARQSRTYPHCIITDPTNKFALIPDLGLDKLFVYRFSDRDGTLIANDPPFVSVKPGAGPRHVRFHPNQKWAYLINEMGSLVNGYTWDAGSGKPTEFQSISSLPANFTGENNSAEIEVHPTGKFLYVTNRGHDSIAAFSIDQMTGKLALIQHVPSQGRIPRNFAFDPTGKWMLCTNQESNSAVVFRIDQETGKLTQVGPSIEILAPCCERFLPVP